MGKNLLEMENLHSQQKESKMQYFGAIWKMTEWSLFFPRQNIQYHSNPCLYSKQECQRSWSWMVLWSSTRPSRTNTHTHTHTHRCPFHHREMECKNRKLRDTWSNRQVWPWSTKWSRAKANRVLPRECKYSGHSKHPLPTIQKITLHMDITR